MMTGQLLLLYIGKLSKTMILIDWMLRTLPTNNLLKMEKYSATVEKNDYTHLLQRRFTLTQNLMAIICLNVFR